MSYEPTEWKNGDIITAQKLNKIENAIGTIYLVGSQLAVGIETLMFNGETPVSYQMIIEGINAGRQFNLMVGSAENLNILPFSGCYQQETQTDTGTEYHVVFTNGSFTKSYASLSLIGALTYSSASSSVPFTPGEGGGQMS